MLMELHRADCLLEEARLRQARGDLPGAREQLAQAEALCRRLGYGRRLPEAAALRREGRPVAGVLALAAARAGVGGARVDSSGRPA